MEVSCFWHACFFLGIPMSCVLWRSMCDGGEMLSLHENTCDCSYLLGDAQPPLPSSVGLWQEMWTCR